MAVVVVAVAEVVADHTTRVWTAVKGVEEAREEEEEDLIDRLPHDREACLTRRI